MGLGESLKGEWSFFDLIMIFFITFIYLKMQKNLTFK